MASKLLIKDLLRARRALVRAERTSRTLHHDSLVGPVVYPRLCLDAILRDLGLNQIEIEDGPQDLRSVSSPDNLEKARMARAATR